ncbi:MAG TPA: ribonuclease PH [Trueperaceae bacterium]
MTTVPARDGRLPAQLRRIEVTTGYLPHAEGSALVSWGRTRVLASVTIENKLPPHLRGTAAKGGWLTAEYAMLPRSTADRSPRERLYASGRTQEIQRLIGRALRTTVDLAMFRGKTITIDVDVLSADGGTRCAGVVAAYAAMHEAADRLVFAGALDEWPLRHEVGAVSVGVVGGEQRLDLDYAEDAVAAVDLNVVATASGEVVEVQGAGEGEPVASELYVALLATGIEGVKRVLDVVRPQLKRAGA